MADTMKGLKRTHYCGTVTPELVGREVVVCGWAQKTRDMGTLVFIDLRDRTGIVQLAFDDKSDGGLLAKAQRVRAEYVLMARGVLRRRESVNHDIPTGEVEVYVTELRVLAESATPPFAVSDDSRGVKEELRLKYRYLDLRRPEMQNAIAMRHRIVKVARDYYDTNGFLEIETPVLIKSTPEGARDYLVPSRVQQGKFYALPQSPQLYKQILMSTGLDRVFEIGPAFRAEHSNTNRHVTEFISFDGEMSWIEKEEDVMAMIEEIVDHVLRGLKEKGAKQLEILGKEINVPARPYPILTYSECLKIVNDAGLPLKEGDDLGTEGEKIVGDHMAEKGCDLYFIAEYPEEAKPFYIMEKDGTSYSYSFDLDYRGQEISSGGQREHRYDKLVARMEKKGLNPDDFTFYLDAFKYGMPPHGGWGIGIERLLVKMLDLPNIREAILFPRDPSRLSP